MLIIQRPSVEAIDEEEGNRQRFSISPLEPGFGHTIGNSLRRTLLSSIPGAAITQVRFDDALHEFGTIAGVTEDVTDVILNLKDIVVVSHSDEPVTLRLDVRGAAEVTAGDIQTTADVEILTPDLHLASVNSKGRLAADLTIERGRGYLQADATRGSGTIGVIPVDSIFSPVRRVAFTVEPTRVEQSTNYDRLVLDIETDGSIDARDALASAGATLTSLARFASLGRARVVPVITRMTGSGYAVEVLPAWEGFPSGDLTADAATMNRLLQTYIDTMPTQYYWVHKRFKVRPPGEPPVYG